MKNLYYISGIFLMILCGIFSYYILTSMFLLFYIVLIIPFYGISIGLVMYSNQSAKIKWLTLLTPAVAILTWVIYTHINYQNSLHKSPLLILIPEDLKGEINIVIQQEMGIEPKIENGKQILEVPEDGILLLKSDIEASYYASIDYYLVNKKGGRTRINTIVAPQDKEKGIPSLLNYEDETFYHDFEKNTSFTFSSNYEEITWRELAIIKKDSVLVDDMSQPLVEVNSHELREKQFERITQKIKQLKK